MDIKIQPVHNNTFSCVDSVVATICTWGGRDSILSFGGCWGFEYRKAKSNETTIGERIWTGNNDRSSLLQTYHGVQLNFANTENFEQAFQLICENLSLGIPVGVYTDSYWCPWNPLYQKHHLSHYYIITAWQSNQQIFNCVDPFLSKKDVIQTLHDYKNGYGTLMIFKFLNILPSTSSQLILQRTCQKNLGLLDSINAFTAMRIFANDILLHWDAPREIEGYNNIEYTTFFVLLTNIGWARKNFVSMLRYLCKNPIYVKLTEYADALEKSAEQWQILRSILIRACLRGNQQGIYQKAWSKINEIADYEEDIANRLLNIICNDFV